MEGTPAPAAVIGETLAESTSLPSFADLAGTEREISRAGGGWHELAVSGPGVIDMSASATPGLDGLVLEPADQPAWFAWGINGLGNGLFVDAVQLDMQDAEGEYYIAVSDYASGRWQTLGPFQGTQEIAWPAPLDYLSADGTSYFAVIVPAGQQTVEACSFRVAGDDGDAPFPVNFYPDYSGDAVFLSWWHSPSYSELDFSGYLVARAPYIGGEYQFISPEPFLETQFVDADVEEGVKYRYIVYACDTAGNRSPSPVVVAYISPGYDNPPVVVVEHTPGPLTFPATVRVDLSGSYDPDGDPIEEYEVSVGSNYISVTQTDPVFELELPAGGCRVDVKVRNAKYSYSWFPMTILPSWEDQSYTLIESSNMHRRAYAPRLATDPVSGEHIALYIDTMRSALIASWITETGLEEFGSWPLYNQPEVNVPGVFRFISEPVAFDGKLLLQVRSGGFSQGLELDAAGFRQATYISSGSSGEFQSDLAVDGNGDLWNFGLLGFSNDLVAYQSTGIIGDDIEENLVDPGLIDAEYNAVTGKYEIVYTSNGKIMWAVMDPQDASSTKVSIATMDVYGMDLEYNPYTGTMEVLVASLIGLYHASRDAQATSWNGFAPVDTSGYVSGGVDLSMDEDGRYAFAGIDSSVSRIYYDNGGGWNAGQETAWTNGGYEVSALRLPGEGQTLLMDRAIDRLHIFRMGDEFGQQELDFVSGTDYLGLGLTVEGNRDGIYVATRQGLGLSVYGSSNGESWSEYVSGMGVLPEGIRLSTDQEGSPYLSYVFNNQVKQFHWNGASFDLLNSWSHNEGTMPVVGGSYSHLFMLDQSDQLGDGSVVYQMENFQGDRSYVNGPVQDGVIDGYSTNTFDGLVLYGGTTGYNGAIGYLNNSRNEIRYVSYWGGLPFSDPLIIGRTIDSAYAYFPGLASSGGIYYAASSDSGQPIRVTREGNNFHSETIPVGVTDKTLGEMRRIVSADNTPMFSGVAIISNLQGEVELFEMSTQSRFEPLDFPDIEHGHMYEIVVAQDGRWHIIYRDMQTDDLMIRSTLGPVI